MSIPLSLSGKVALISGGSRGIGAATVRMFAAAGAKVAFSYRSARSQAEALAKECGAGVCHLIVADLNTPEAARALVSETVRHCGRLDILVANHGVWPEQDVPIERMSDEQWRSTLSINLDLLYPQSGLTGYPREAFLKDLVDEAERDIRECIEANAACVQIDFTEGRLALKLDPSGGLLRSFIELNNVVLERFTDAERKRIGVHTCPGGDQDSTHSADVDYTSLLPALFNLKVGRFYVQMASEANPGRVLSAIRNLLKPGQILFVGVTDPIDPKIESPEAVRDRVLAAAKFIPLETLETTDDCGFSPFADDVSTSRVTAFAKVKSRVEGTAMAAKVLGV